MSRCYCLFGFEYILEANVQSLKKLKAFKAQSAYVLCHNDILKIIDIIRA